MKGGFEITGVDDVRKLLEDIAPKHARNLMRATIHGVASTIAKDAKRAAPKQSGVLKKSIKARRKKSPADAPVSEVYILPAAFYWRFVEYGTQGDTARPEHPFVRPAADTARANFEAILTQQFGKKLEAALRKEARKKARK